MLHWFTVDAPVGRGLLREFWWFASRLVLGVTAVAAAVLGCLALALELT